MYNIERETRQKLANLDIHLRSGNQTISISATIYHNKKDLAQAFISKVTSDRDPTAHSFLLCSSLDLAAYASCDQP